MKKYNYPNSNLFRNIEYKEIAYIVGLFWSDGFIVQNRIGIENIKEDIDNIKYLFENIGDFCYNERLRKGRTKKVACIQYCSKEIVDIFKEYNFENKSKVSPNLIKMGIKDENIKYFIRGIMDGDGCINFSNNHPQIYFAITYEQDWTYLEDMVKQLNIKYSIRRIINKKSMHSILYIGGKTNSLLFLDWLYLNYDKDKIGLMRKYNKYIEIVNYKNIKKDMSGSNAPKAKIIKIFDNNNNLRYICNGNFDEVCIKNKLPIASLKKSYRAGGSKIYNSNKGIVEAYKRNNEKYIGWYAIII